MNEATTLRLHESLSQSQAVFHRAASTPLLGPSTIPHPALGNLFSPDNSHVTASVMASMQQTVEKLILRVAKLESLVFLLETERNTGGGGSGLLSSGSTVNLFQDVRATLYETMEPVREQLRRHEAILMDVVQSLNHAAGWGYYKQRSSGDAAPPSPRQGEHHQGAGNVSSRKHAAATASAPLAQGTRQRKNSLGREDDDDNVKHHDQPHHNNDAFVMVSPLTKADTSHLTAATASFMPIVQVDPSTANLEERIVRMRRLAGALGSGVPLGSATVSPRKSRKDNKDKKKKKHHHESDDTSSATSSFSESDQSPIRHHYTTTTEVESSTQPNATSSGATTTTTFIDEATSTASDARHYLQHHHGTGGDTTTNDEAKELIHNVKKILRKTGDDAGGIAATSGLETTSTTTTTTTNSSLLLHQQRHYNGNTSTHLSTPQRAVRFGLDDSLATPLPARYQTGSMFGAGGGGGRMVTSDTTSTSSTSGNHHHTHNDPSNYYRTGVQLLQSPGSATSFQQSRLLANNNAYPQHYATGSGALRSGPLDFPQDSSSLSDGYQELLKRMHM
ncbi:Hypothetical protein, putative [Bodo saltans]|uniref:Uncharacterized protein n=1 Tax=Bodo saltans TaxID=75058 RepID=A0A0S4IZF5_BODSA|nr:Hypothetical protein, putative [Bodo saltans]|eukprot:CUG66669.1 Hypothetical protein, putative [Bodo saltans]